MSNNLFPFTNNYLVRYYDPQRAVYRSHNQRIMAELVEWREVVMPFRDKMYVVGRDSYLLYIVRSLDGTHYYIDQDGMSAFMYHGDFGCTTGLWKIVQKGLYYSIVMESLNG